MSCLHTSPPRYDTHYSVLSSLQTLILLSSRIPPSIPILLLLTNLFSCSNFLQILEYDETGQLIPVAEHSLHERIIGLAVHKPPHYGGQDHLFILTDNKVAFTCSWDLETQSLRNERVIEGLSDSALRPSEASERVRLDPGNRVIGLNLYQGLLTFILIHQHVPIKGRKSLTSNIPENTILEAVSLRTRVLNLANFVFLKTDGVYPYIAVLWKDNELKRFLSLWEIDKLYKAGDRDFVEHRWANGEKNVLVDRGANLLIPTANGTHSPCIVEN
jgi:Mono-functional DNA-alkylating methyl methanesulfonate N-term